MVGSSVCSDKKRRRDCLGVPAPKRLMQRLRNFGTLFHEAFAFGTHRAFSILPPFAYLSTNDHTPILLRFAEIGRWRGVGCEGHSTKYRRRRSPTAPEIAGCQH